MEAMEAQHNATTSTEFATPERPLLPLTKRDRAPGKTNGLAFLDGLRGIAALIVYSHHHITEYYGIDCDLMHAYGYEGRHHFGQWRFIHLFFAGGTPAVMMFFVLSGYVLSRGVLQMVQNEKSSPAILQYLLNAVLRRPIRLWLPPILVSIPVALAFHTPFRPVGAFLKIQSNIFAELRAFLIGVLETINPFVGHGPFLQSFQYNPPVWTMTYELNGSLVVYTVIAMCGPFLSVRNRMFAFAFTLFVSFEYGHFSLVPFVLGMIVAQIDVAMLDAPYFDRMAEYLRPLIFNGIFFIGWYLLSDTGPLVKSETPWFGLPVQWIPFFFYHNPNLATNTLGACCLVYASLRLSWLQKCLNHAAWLGRISFALYLTHVPVMWFLGIRVRRCLEAQVDEAEEKAFFDGMFPIPDVGPLGLTTRYLAMQLIVLPLNLILAEVVTVWIDQTSVVISKRYAAKVMQSLHL